MKKTALAAAILSILMILAGCAADLPRYAVPEGANTADLKSDIWGATDRNESITVYVAQGGCVEPQRKTLFYIRDSKSEPGGAVKIEADHPLRLEYFENSSGGWTCNVSVDINLERGKSYSLVGGFAYKAGPIPIFTGTRMCQFGVQDDADKSLVSQASSCSR